MASEADQLDIGGNDDSLRAYYGVANRMHFVLKVSATGRCTFPKALRKRLGLEQGGTLIIDEDAEGRLLIRETERTT